MSAFSSSAPAPSPGEPHIQPLIPTPGPVVVPPKQPGKRRRKLWGISLMVLAILGVAGYYWASQNAKATGGGSMISVPTVAADNGMVVATIRINGTIVAKNQANILAPRIQ